MPIYYQQAEYQRFIDLIKYYRFADALKSYSNLMLMSKEKREEYLNELIKSQKVLVKIFAYCLMPNHFHLLLQQVMENGLTTFISKVQNGFAKYFNQRNDRVGPLFQSMFKAVRIESEEQLLHTSRYIHLNPTTSFLIRKNEIFNYPWSSLPTYVGEGGAPRFGLVNTKLFLRLIGGKAKYRVFVLDQIDHQRKLSEIKHLTME